MTGPDSETRAAIAALVHRLRNRGEEPGQYAEDDEVFAQEYLTALKSRGWRPVLAVPPDADWRRASGNSRTPRGSIDPGTRAALLAKMAEASAATRSGRRATGPQPALTENDDQQEAS